MNNDPVTKQDLLEAVSTMKGYIDARADEITEKLRDVETHLLTEFHRYGQGQQIRLCEVERADKVLVERLGIIEQRLLALEMRIRPER